MPLQEGQQHCHLVRGRIAVLRRAPDHDIGDIQRQRRVRGPAHQADGREHPVQKLARAAHEGTPFLVLVPPRCFAHHHHPRAGQAIGKDQRFRPAFQIAVLKGGQRGTQRRQILRLCCGFGRHPHRNAIIRCSHGGRCRRHGARHRNGRGQGGNVRHRLIAADRCFPQGHIRAKVKLPGQRRKVCVKGQVRVHACKAMPPAPCGKPLVRSRRAFYKRPDRDAPAQGGSDDIPRPPPAGDRAPRTRGNPHGA